MNKGPTVLIVDDDAVQVALLLRIVNLGWPAAQVHTAMTVAHARMLIEQQPIALVITDYHMADGTGLNVLSAARAADPTCAVVVISGDLSVELITRMAGPTAFLGKPIDIFALNRLIQRIAVQPVVPSNA